MAKSKPLAKSEAALARTDLIQSLHTVNDEIKDKWIDYVDPAGNASSSPNSYMTMRKHCNRKFGIKSVKDITGDIIAQHLYAIANYRSAQLIEQLTTQQELRAEIRNQIYQEFTKTKEIYESYNHTHS